MTANEIIKALKCCGNQMYLCNDRQCKSKTLGDAIDLIKRQKAEIERLREESNRWQKAFENARKDATIEKCVSGYIIDACLKEIIGGKR